MNPSIKSSLRAAALGVAILGLTSSAFARSSINRVYLNCNHEDTLSEFQMIPEVGLVPMNMDLEVAGAGCGTMMPGPVVCISQDYLFVNAGAAGSATFKLRDGHGDVLVYKTTRIATWLTPREKHAAAFEGEYVVDTAKCTGRYAGATGSGTIKGWADNDNPMPSVVEATPDGFPILAVGSGQGYAQMVGSLVLKKVPCTKI